MSQSIPSPQPLPEEELYLPSGAAEPHSGSYRDVLTHKMMLEDAARTSAYAAAIAETVKPEHRVVDFGSGTGVLAIFAARQHPQRVDAIERTSMVHFARQIATRSGHPEIVFHHGDHRSFDTDGPVDVIVSEWMGHFVFYEAMLEPLLELRDRWLKPNGIMLPRRITLHLGFVTDKITHEEDTFLHGSPYGVDFSPIAELPSRQTRLITLYRDQLLKTDCELCVIDMETVKVLPERYASKTTAKDSGRIYGLVGWFSADLSDTVKLGTGPDDPLTHWRQMYFPLPQAVDVNEGDVLEVSIRLPQTSDIPDPGWAWSLKIGDNGQSVDERETFMCSLEGGPRRRKATT